MSNMTNIHFKYDISDLLNLKDPKDPNDQNDKKYDELKIRIEENIKMLKDQIFQLMELSFKTKSQIELLTKSQKDLSDFISEIRDTNIDIEGYKKITNERIEKIFKLLMITHEKLNINITK